MFIYITNIIKKIKSKLFQTKRFGDITNQEIISVKGIYSNPINEKALAIKKTDSTSKYYIIPLQKEITNLEENDVVITDNNSYIHFNFKDNKIIIKGNTIIKNKFKIEGNLEVTGEIINKHISDFKTHFHAHNGAPPTIS